MQLTNMLNQQVNMKDKTSTEEAILMAAEKEFMEKGYALSKTTEIAKAAGVTHAMLHYYFRTKDNLFNKVFQEKVKLMASSFAAITDENLPFLERLQKGVEAHFDLIAGYPKLPFFVISEILASDDRKERCKHIFLPVIQETLHRLETAILAEVPKGTIRNINPLDLMLNIISLNVFVFIASPIVQMMATNSPEEYAGFLERRKKENVETILSRIRL